jgi:hypothetical protein
VTAWFTDAWEEIENMEQNGTETRTINMMKGYYSQAESEWQVYDYDRTKLYLQKIIALPETTLLPILSLLLLLLLLRRPRLG